MLHSDSAEKRSFDNFTTYMFESLMPNQTTAQELANLFNSFYFSDASKHNVDSLLEETTEVSPKLVLVEIQVLQSKIRFSGYDRYLICLMHLGRRC